MFNKTMTIVINADTCTITVGGITGNPATANFEPAKTDRYLKMMGAIAEKIYEGSGITVYVMELTRFMTIAALMGKI